MTSAALFPQKVPKKASDVKSSVKKERPDSSGPQLKKQRVSGAFGHSEKVKTLLRL